MMWWFLILAASVVAVVWSAIAIYMRVRGGLKQSPGESSEEIDQDSPQS